MYENFSFIICIPKNLSLFSARQIGLFVFLISCLLDQRNANKCKQILNQYPSIFFRAKDTRAFATHLVKCGLSFRVDCEPVLVRVSSRTYRSCSTSQTTISKSFGWTSDAGNFSIDKKHLRVYRVPGYTRHRYHNIIRARGHWTWRDTNSWQNISDDTA